MRNLSFINLIVLLLVFVLGLFLGFKFDVHSFTKDDLPIEVRENPTDYSFINPLYYIRVSKNFYIDEYKNLDYKLNDFINKQISNNLAKSISVYYRDLNTGHWTGVNENDKYHPSSMLKVLGLMAYYRRSEQETNLLSKSLHYKSINDPGQHYKPQSVLSNGVHSIDHLLEQMIVYSDNDVLGVLDKEDKDNIFNKAYHDLRLPLASSTEDIDGYMSPRSYSSLFRTLYNSTYLSRDNSEKALKLLSRTKFDSGITSAIPKDIVVSHKFGEHTNELENGEIVKRELHDCGIVYYPRNPYLICVMTSGDNFDNLEKAISKISSIVYEYQSNF